MGKGKLLSIFSLWALFACSITEPEDISYIGDAVKQNVIWSYTAIETSGEADAAALSFTETDYVIWRMKIRCAYYHDIDNKTIFLTGQVRTNDGAKPAMIRLQLWGLFSGGLIKQEEISETSTSYVLRTITMDIDSLSLDSAEIYELKVLMLTGASGGQAKLYMPVIYTLGG